MKKLLLGLLLLSLSFAVNETRVIGDIVIARDTLISSGNASFATINVETLSPEKISFENSSIEDSSLDGNWDFNYGDVSDVGNLSAVNIVADTMTVTTLSYTATNASTSNYTVNGTLTVTGNANIAGSVSASSLQALSVSVNGNVSSDTIYANTGAIRTVIVSTANVSTLNASIIYSSSISNSGLISSNTFNANNATVNNLSATTLNATNVIGTLKTASQPNITGLGTIANLVATNATFDVNYVALLRAVSSNINVSNISTLNSGVINNSGKLIVTDTTQAISSVNGSVQLAGGIAVKKSANIGGDLTVAGAMVGSGEFEIYDKGTRLIKVSSAGTDIARTTTVNTLIATNATINTLKVDSLSMTGFTIANATTANLYVSGNLTVKDFAVSQVQA